ncbi:MAG: Arabinose 5-phosphate isomerase KdsD [Chlamydiia bacterium]|nr:Arabinose 5-phosphate isomerase KdsD [Chlamydiia bacterium]MCH9618894.1 Arabinose 5-phosphate isomerase KdsD [Chlamydiia bacterium]MCH9624561.1 Arabinose 5-phosphate isomerase KdsD [Chlamydiia bacterium]
MLKEIFAREKQFLNYFFQEINMDEANKVLALILGCKGMVIFSGVGKSGIIAEKLSKTMISTGSRSLYLSPQEALHGDIGIATKDDLIILLSKSGKGLEIENLAKTCKKRGVYTMAWVSDKGGALEKYVDFTMRLPLQGEICPFGLAPTTSTALQLIFGDCLAVALMQASKFSLDQYALNHPAGSIGKLIAESVQDVMVTGDDLPICNQNMPLKDALFTLSDKKLGTLLINNDDGTFLGIFTDGDLRRLIEKDGSSALDQRLNAVVNTDYTSIEKRELTSKALEIMENAEKRILLLPVVEDGLAIGIIHMHHIISANISPSLRIH